MYQTYLITGATGFLGRAVLQLLLAHSCRILALVMDKDPLAYTIPENVTVFCGDLTDKDTLRSFFAAGGDNFCVLHCAGIVSVASKPDEAIYRVNVQGTQNIIDLCCEFGAEKLVYVSSVHAIPEKPKNCVITEDCEFSPGLVDGDYAKSKAAATELVFSAARQGLNVSIVFPSGIIGPGDVSGGSFTSMAKSFLAGKLPFAVRGGYDFVDVRDVAKGILACAESGEPGKGYILSGHYITIRRMLRIVGKAAKLIYRPICLPLKLARLAAPYCERRCLKEKKPLFFTPYSIAVLGSNGRFTHDAASERFAYRPRPIEETLRDMTAWLVSRNAKAGSAP